MALFNYTVIIFGKMFMGSLIDSTSLPIAMIFPIVMFAIASVISGFVASRNSKIRRTEALAYPPTSPITEIDVP
jgi:hypothetical protein